MNWQYVSKESNKYPMPRGRCAVQAASIATGMTFDETYEALRDLCEARGLQSPSQAGVPVNIYEEWLQGLGWKPISVYGQPIESLPMKGRFIVEFLDHATALINGTILDFQDSRGRTVYRYWVYQT